MAVLQFTFDGVVFGAGQSIGVRSVVGLDHPPVRTSDQDRPLTAGWFAGRDLPAGRVFEVEVFAHAATTTEAEALLAPLRAVSNPRETEELPFVFELPGQVARRIFCRVRRRAAPLNRMRMALAVAQDLIEFAASDPRIYTDIEASGATGFPVVSGGRTYNLTFPRTYGTLGTGGTISALNEGDTPAPWQATITGPWDDPRIENVTLGKTLRMTLTLAAGEHLVIDSADKSILLGGTASRYSSLQVGSEWFDLAVGTNEVRFAGSAGSGTAELRWRSAWLSAA